MYFRATAQKAEKVLRETLDMKRRVFGPEHPITLEDMTSSGGVVLQEGRYTEAENLEREARDIQRRVLGPEHFDTARFHVQPRLHRGT